MTTTENNNRLFAEFMQPSFNDFEAYDFSDEWLTVDLLKFHTDWNWLMPVVEKINDLNNVVEIHENWVRVVNNEKSDVLADIVAGTMKESVYNACLDFIKWYNTQNTTS